MDHEQILWAFIIGVSLALYGACGVLTAWMLHLTQGSLPWFACIVAWPVVLVAAFFLISIPILIVISIVEG